MNNLLPPTVSRRRFLRNSMIAAAALPLASMVRAASGKELLFKISLAEWTLVRDLRNGTIDHLDFPAVARKHGIDGIEYVNQFFMDKAKDTPYLRQMKQRAEDQNVQSLILMCDQEGRLGDPDEARRKQAVENHYKWVEAAKFLGCHSIRVNAGSEGSREEQRERVVDGLSRLTEFGDQHGINVLVENHGGLSSDGQWLASVMQAVGHPRCGTLPDFGNFRISDGVTYDAYEGVKELMPFAKGVSVKDRSWDGQGDRIEVDFVKMMRIVLDAGYRGYCGIEFGGMAGLDSSRQQLERVRDQLENEYQ